MGKPAWASRIDNPWKQNSWFESVAVAQERARKRLPAPVYDALVDHRFGDSHPTRLLGRRVFLANYSPTRLFYSSRNRVIVIRRYGFGAWFWADAWFTAKAWIKLLLLEQHRGTKIRAGLRGIRAGLVFPARERRW